VRGKNSRGGNGAAYLDGEPARQCRVDLPHGLERQRLDLHAICEPRRGQQLWLPGGVGAFGLDLLAKPDRRSGIGLYMPCRLDTLRQQLQPDHQSSGFGKQRLSFGMDAQWKPLRAKPDCRGYSDLFVPGRMDAVGFDLFARFDPARERHAALQCGRYSQWQHVRNADQLRRNSSLQLSRIRGLCRHQSYLRTGYIVHTACRSIDLSDRHCLVGSMVFVCLLYCNFQYMHSAGYRWKNIRRLGYRLSGQRRIGLRISGTWAAGL